MAYWRGGRGGEAACHLHVTSALLLNKRRQQVVLIILHALLRYMSHDTAAFGPVLLTKSGQSRNSTKFQI